MKFLKFTGPAAARAGAPSRWRNLLPTTKPRIVGAIAVAAAMVMTSSGSAGAVGSKYGPTTPLPAVGTRTSGGTVYLAEGPSAPPTYILPFVNINQCSTVNFGFFQMQYRPLYWYDNSNTPSVDYNDSLANPPVFSGGNSVITITLKHYMWSDGEQVTSRDVQFWMNMMFADKLNWCDYTGGFFPDNVKSVGYPNSSTIVFHLKRSYNPTWYLYNELSQIFPLPMAWDRTSLSAPVPTATTPNLPDTTAKGVNAVYDFLDCQAGDQVNCAKGTKAAPATSWPSNPLWQVVDGPFKLASFSSTNEVTLVPNPDYSGSPKPSIAKFVYVPFTSDGAILNEIKSGGPKALSIVNLPDEYYPQLKSIEAEGYTATNFTPLLISYFPLNLHNPKFGPVFDQKYFRQAFAHLVDQPGWITHILHGYAAPTYGPVPVAPPNSFADSFEQSNPYPFSVSDAASILKAHGWTNVGPGETATCAAANLCAPGHPSVKGLKLAFNLDYQSGATVTDEEIQDLKSQAAQVGIDLQLTTHPFQQVVGAAWDCGIGGKYHPGQPECNWTAEDWGAGWVFAPDYEPTGESIFYTGSVSNQAGWDDSHNDYLINQTTTAPASQTKAAIYKWENYVVDQAPFVFIPSATGDPTSATITLTSKHLGGYTNNLSTALNPETLWLTK